MGKRRQEDHIYNSLIKCGTDGLYKIYGKADDISELHYIDNEDFAISMSKYNRMGGDITDIYNACISEHIEKQEEVFEKIKKVVFRQIRTNYGYTMLPRIIFLAGNGGTGKSTIITEFAIKLAKEYDVYLTRLDEDTSESFAQNVYEEIKTRSNEGVVFLMVDAPCANEVEFKKMLLMENNKNVRLIVSERYSRLTYLFKDPSIGHIVDFASAIMLDYQCNEFINFVHRRNVTNIGYDISYKKRIVGKMVYSNIQEGVSDDAINEILSSIAFENVSICEAYLKFGLEYNKIRGSLEFPLQNKMKFDWDEWVEIFDDGEGKSNENTVTMGEMFPYIAVLGLYKIPMSLRLMSNLTCVEKGQVHTLLYDKLATINEPVIYFNDMIKLRHDIIGDLYFLAHPEKSPQILLEKLIDYLDEEMVIQFEKKILSAKIIRGRKLCPNDEIDTVRLLELFSEKQDYIECLKKNNRLFSLKWSQLASYVLDEKNINMESETAEMMFQDRWKELWSESDGSNDVNHRLALSIWHNCFSMCVEYDFDPPGVFYGILDDVDYRIMTKEISNFEKYVLNNGYNIIRYRRIARKLLEQITEQVIQDIPSRLILAEILVQQNADEVAERLYDEAIKTQEGEKYKLYTSYAKYCEKRYKSSKKVIKSNVKYKNKKKDVTQEFSNKNGMGSNKSNTASQTRTSTTGRMTRKKHKRHDMNRYKSRRQEYYKRAEKYYQEAVDIADGEEKSVSLCAMARFLQNSFDEVRNKNKKRERCIKIEALFLKALEYGNNNYSALCGLAMLYANSSSHNPLFDSDNAVKMFEKAEEADASKTMLTLYVPWGTLLYCIGDLDVSLKLFIKARKMKGKTIGAIAGIDLIETEKLTIERMMLGGKPISSIDDYYKKYIVQSGRDNKLKKNRFKDENVRTEAKRIVVWTLFGEECCDVSMEKLRKCMCIIRSLLKYDSNDIYLMRMMQRVDLLNKSCEKIIHKDEKRRLANIMFCRLKTKERWLVYHETR